MQIFRISLHFMNEIDVVFYPKSVKRMVYIFPILFK